MGRKKKKRIKNNSPINKKASPKSNTLKKLKNNKHTHTHKNYRNTLKTEIKTKPKQE